MTGKLNIKNIKLVRWFVPLELNHTSYIYTSLVEFTGNNNIKFEISSKNLNKKGKLTIVDNQVILHNNSTYSKVTFIEIEFKDNSKRRYAFDLSDSPNDFPYFALENSDLVLKGLFYKKP